jgi:hypothetical protein
VVGGVEADGDHPPWVQSHDIGQCVGSAGARVEPCHICGEKPLGEHAA